MGRRPSWIIGAALIAGLIGASDSLVGCAPSPKVPRVEPVTRRSLDQGDVVGFIPESGAHVWRGIPYAKAPVGEGRWRASRPPEPWQGVWPALSFGSPCVQLSGLLSPSEPGVESGDVMGSEDCLYANVYAPPFTPHSLPQGGGKLPVMVWIHGGGNMIGAANVYDGSLLALRHHVVVVTLNYRLGALGWLTHPSLHDEGESADDRSGNYGSLDLIRGLEWVRENIEAFGGDPEKVTIFGQSAGGRNVISLLVSPRARGLFHRAISQSGVTDLTPMSEARNAVADEPAGHRYSSGEVLLTLLVDSGRASDRAHARELSAELKPSEIRAFLRGISVHELLGAYGSTWMGGVYSMPQHFRDGAVLPDAESAEALADLDSESRVPVIFGTNRDETKLFMLGSSPDVARLFGIPLWLSNAARYDLFAEYRSLMKKVKGADAPANALTSAPHPGVFVYRFDWDEEPKLLTADFSRMLGATHGLEIPFLFGELNFLAATPLVFSEEARPQAEELSRQMMSYWVSFARSGDPGRGVAEDLPRWERWDSERKEGARFMILDSESDGGLRLGAGSLTRSGVLARATVDHRFASVADMCQLFAGFTRSSVRMSEAEYAEIAGGACRDHPPADVSP